MSEQETDAKDAANAGDKTDVRSAAVPSATANSDSRPIGFLWPEHERMRRALKALSDGRLDDIQPNIDAISDADDPTRAWTHWLTGRLLARRHRAAEALEHLERCIAACASGAGSTDELDRNRARLQSAAWEDVGVLRRRREELSAARQAHEEAHRLRCAHGSFEECWSSAHEVALTAIIAGALDDAEAWCRKALNHADQIEQAADLYRARSFELLAEVASKAKHPQAAVGFARHALECYTQHDPGSLETAKAEASLIRLLVTAAEAALGTDQAAVTKSLDEALQRAPAVEQSLRAFGADQDALHVRELTELGTTLRDEM